MPKTREELTRRRREILSILDSNAVVENLDDLLDQLEVRGFRVSKASVSRDLKELGIARVNGRFRIPTVDREDQMLQRVVGFIRKVVPVERAERRIDPPELARFAEVYGRDVD